MTFILMNLMNQQMNFITALSIYHILKNNSLVVNLKRVIPTDTLSLNINTDIHKIVTKHNLDPNKIQVSSLSVNESNRSSITKAPSTLLGIHRNIPESTINVDRAKKIVKDKRVFCLYCEELVTNFKKICQNISSHQ